MKDTAKTIAPRGVVRDPRVNPDELAIAHRLYLIASTVPSRYPVTVIASDLLALLNGFVGESKRADQAEAQNAILLAASAAPSPSDN